MRKTRITPQFIYCHFQGKHRLSSEATISKRINSHCQVSICKPYYTTLISRSNRWGGGTFRNYIIARKKNNIKMCCFFWGGGSQIAVLKDAVGPRYCQSTAPETGRARTVSPLTKDLAILCRPACRIIAV